MLALFFCTWLPPPNSHLKPPGRCPISASHFFAKFLVGSVWMGSEEFSLFFFLRSSFFQEWPWQTKPKKGQFMNFSQGHSGTKVQCESCLFPKEKHQNSPKWAKFMNFSFWPFLWFGLPGRLLSFSFFSFYDNNLLQTWGIARRPRLHGPHAKLPDCFIVSLEPHPLNCRHIRNYYLSNSKTFQDGNGNGNFEEINSNDFLNVNWESMEMKGWLRTPRR